MIQMNAAMEMQRQNSLAPLHPFYKDGWAPPDSVLAGPDPATIVPNRIFVGGIDYKVSDSDLWLYFSRFGAVKEAKVVLNRSSGVSKGYGFVTFETQEEVLKILSNADGFCFKEKKIFVGQAVKKRQPPGQPLVTALEPGLPHHVAFETFLTTSTGCPYTYHNGVAYFHSAPLAPRCAPAPQLMFCQHHLQVPMPSGAAIYPQHAENLNLPTDGGSFLSPVPVMEVVSPEMFPPSHVHQKTNYGCFLQPKDCHHPPDAFGFHAPPPLL